MSSSGYRKKGGRPLVAIRWDGEEFEFGSVKDFLESSEPGERSKLDRFEVDRHTGRVCECLDGTRASFGGWRFKALRQFVDLDSMGDDDQKRKRMQKLTAAAAAGNAMTEEDVKVVLRESYLDTLNLANAVRVGKQESPKGWKAKDDIELFQKVAEAWGIDWRHVVDTRSDGDKAQDAVAKLLGAPEKLFELSDAELEAIERSMVDAFYGVKGYLEGVAVEEDVDVLKEGERLPGETDVDVVVEEKERVSMKSMPEEGAFWRKKDAVE